jgi:hypothetical protein
MGVQKAPDYFRLSFSEFPQRPGERLDDQVIAIGNYEPADSERTACVAASAPRFVVQRHCADHRGPAPPAVLRVRPPLN